MQFDLDRAKLGALFCITQQVEKALILLEGDWSNAEPNAAGLAGAMLLSQAKFAHAEIALNRAVDGQASDIGAHQTNLGRAILLQGRPEDALIHLADGVINAKHDKNLALQSQCEALLRLERVDEALALFPESLDDKELLSMRATILGIANRHDEAAELLSRATQNADENDISLLLMSADLASMRGRSGESMRILQKAKALSPDSIEILSQIIHSGHKAQVSHYSRKAVDELKDILSQKEADGNSTPQLQALGLEAEAFILMADCKLKEAEANYKAALAINPKMPAALSGLGQLYLETGQVDEAKRQFELLRAVAPLMGWNQLFNIREVPEEPDVLLQMEHLARQPSLEGPMKYSLLLNVSAAWDKKKEHDKAMELAIEANQAATHHLTYKPEVHRAKIDRIIARYSKAFCDSRKNFGSDSRLPVFVLGMPRSGTTLTEQILASHSQVFGAGELGVINQQVGKLETWQRKLGSGISYPECIIDVNPFIAKGYAEQILEALQGHDPSASHVIDKLPHNFENIGLIKLLFPNAVIFHCRREARDIAISNFMTDYAAKFGGMGFAYDLDWIGQQLVDHNRIMQHWHDVFPGQIMEVVYEDLVEDTPKIAQQMIEFLDLDWEDGVLSHQELDRSVRTASVWQVRQPVYKTSKARWKRYEKWLTPLENALQEQVLIPEPLVIPEMEPALFTKGTGLLGQKRPNDAKECFVRIIQEFPRHAAAHHFLGAAQLQLGDTEAALVAMRKSVKLLPIHASWFENLAVAEESAGNTHYAKRAKEHADKLKNKVQHEI
jgi:tetratricopeptide (TPR) repeat protein